MGDLSEIAMWELVGVAFGAHVCANARCHGGADVPRLFQELLCKRVDSVLGACVAEALS